MVHITWISVARFFPKSFMLSSKLIFANLLISGVVIKPIVPGILPALVTTLVISGILLSIYVALVCKAAFVTRLVIPGILFSASVAFVLKVAVVTIPEQQVSSFQSL